MVKKTLALILVATLLNLNTGGLVKAISESVELTVPSTQLSVNGKAAPNSLVTIKDGNSIVASVTSNNSGSFATTFSSTPGLHDISVYYNDINSSQSAINKKSISVQPQQETIRTVFLSPTIKSTSNLFQKGSIIQLRGYTYANSPVTVNIDYGPYIQTANSNAQGFYEFLIDSSLLSDGSHIATVSAKSGIDTSDVSNQLNFSIKSESENSSNNQSNQSPAIPDFVVSPEQLPPPIPESPEDGSIISGDLVVVSGNSVPNAQINIYENGQLVGSTFSDDAGSWTFEYKASFSPVTLSFEACIDGRCSVLSKTTTLYFENIGDCSVDFRLEKYRFWGVEAGDTVELQIKDTTGEGIFTVDWDDSTDERFDFDGNQTLQIRKSYNKAGQYNGKITFKQGDCEKLRYFSVDVSNNDEKDISWQFFWIFLIVALMLLVRQLSNKDRQKPVQNP